jgi:DNA-directed RNA polymerase specialized sigma24 family protein
MRTRSGGKPPACPTTRRSAAIHGQIPHPRTDGDADQAVAALYQMHYRSLVRLAALLVSDLATAEDIVQDSFAAVHGMWHALPDTDTDAALCYLRRSVVRRSRSAPRPQLAGIPLLDSAVVSALQALPVRQREVLVLQYFADLPETEIASATGISTAAVRSQAARAMSSLQDALRPAGG